MDLKEKESNLDEDKIEKDYEEKRKDYINKLSKLYESDLKDENFENPLIFIMKNSNVYQKVDLSNENLNDKTSRWFLEQIKST